MRIRKHASKILGSAASPLSWLSPPPPPPAAASHGPAAELLLRSNECQLNRSPWDVTPFPPSSSSPQEDEEGIMGNGVEREGPEPVIASCDSVVKEEPETPKMEEGEEEEESTKNRPDARKKRSSTKKRVKEEEMEMEAGAVTAVATCKKTDGKRWQCKRPAAQPHTFCAYHLSQLRSYTYTSTRKVPAGEAAAAPGKGRSRRKREVMAAASVGSGSSYYYYYSAFGPWRGKRRGGGEDGSCGGVKEEEEQEEEEEETEGKGGGSDQHSDSGDGDAAPPTVCDDLDESVDEDDDAGDEDNAELSDHQGGISTKDQKKKNPRNRRKRGRKPVKARSLKSLL